MDSLRKKDPGSRYVAFAAVVALHLVLLLMVARVASTSHQVQDVLEDALLLVRIDHAKPPPRLNPPTRERQVDVAAPAISARSTDEAPPAQSAPATSPPPNVDWRSNAIRSAQLAVEEASLERYRTFGPRKDTPRDDESVPSLFADEAKHQSGDVGEGVNGDPVVWINENCYTTLDKAVQTARDWVISNPGNFAPAAINCVGGEIGRFSMVMPNPASFTPPSFNYSIAMGRKKPNGKLFEHIKKQEEPPVPKAGTELNELPSEIEPSEIEPGEAFER
jgi:hypothetical protein